MTTLQSLQNNLPVFGQKMAKSVATQSPVSAFSKVNLSGPAKDELNIRFGNSEAVENDTENKVFNVSISDQVYSLLTNIMDGVHYAASSEQIRNQGFNAENTWQVTLGKACLQDADVQKYLTENGFEAIGLLNAFTMLENRIQQRFKNDPKAQELWKPLALDFANDRSTKNGTFALSRTIDMTFLTSQVIKPFKDWSAKVGIEKPTKVDVWRWLMKTQSQEEIFGRILTEFLIKDEKRIARLAEAPPAKDSVKDAGTNRVSKSELLKLEDAMQIVPNKIIGQDKATRRFLDNIELSKLDPEVDEAKPHRPKVRALLLGPSGTGKTYMLDTYAEAMDAIPIYVNLSQYKDETQLTKLTGTGHGYSGFDDPSLADKILSTQAANPSKRIVLVLDEIEKAHEGVRDILMQPMDVGRMENSKLETVFFDNVDIVMTSNIGQKEIEQRIAQDPDVTEDELEEMVRNIMEAQGWRQEFIGRINNVVVFRTLEQDAIRKILDINVKSTSKAFRRYGFELQVEDELKNKIVEMVEPFRTKTGAREIMRYRERILKAGLMKVTKELIKRDALTAQGEVGASLHAHWSHSKDALSFIYASPEHNFKFTFDEKGKVITEESTVPFKDDEGNDILPPEKPEKLKPVVA